MGDYAFLMAFVCFFSYVFGKGIGGESQFGETGDLVFLIVVGIPLLAGLSHGTIGLDMAWLTIGIAALAGLLGVRTGRRSVKQLG